MPVPIISFFSSLKNDCYNKNMMNYDSKNNRTTGECCGRPMVYAKSCDCNYPCGPASEYCGCSLGRIKKDADPCKSCCVIPAITVDTVSGLPNLANCLVHVTGTNTTYYIDDKHRPMIIWAGPVEVDEYDIEENELGLRAQTCYTTISGTYSEVYFDKRGVGHIIGTEAQYGL